MAFIRKNYGKRTAALTVIWIAVFVVFTNFYYRTACECRGFLELSVIFLLGWIFSIAVLNKPKKEEETK